MGGPEWKLEMFEEFDWARPLAAPGTAPDDPHHPSILEHELHNPVFYAHMVGTIAEFYEIGARTAKRTSNIETSRPAFEGAGETWRLVPWVEGTRATERASTEAEARETARAFGRFLAHLQDLPPPPLHETILAFHDTPSRLVERSVHGFPQRRHGQTLATIHEVRIRASAN